MAVQVEQNFRNKLGTKRNWISNKKGRKIRPFLLDIRYD